MDCDVIKYLSNLLKQTSTSILKESLWTISNIIAGSSELVPIPHTRHI